MGNDKKIKLKQVYVESSLGIKSESYGIGFLNLLGSGHYWYDNSDWFQSSIR